MFFSTFDFMFSLMPIIFLVVFGLIVVIIIRGISEWSHNNQQPQIPTYAKIVAKRTDTSVHHHQTGENMTHMTHHTTHHVTFEFTTGDRMELVVSGRAYGSMAELDEGILTIQGTRFIDFERARG